ncbi:MAG: hypothetical protein LBK74_00465 [Treponema sp.]|jgi:hypothetical protein|nr:hypothetical protein [Treponema sp.]
MRCETIGELKKAIASFPDDTKLVNRNIEGEYFVEVWKLTKDDFLYEEEKIDAKVKGRKPDFMRVGLAEGEW